MAIQPVTACDHHVSALSHQQVVLFWWLSCLFLSGPKVLDSLQRY